MGYDWGQAKSDASVVKLNVHGDCSHLITPSGRQIAVGADRMIEVGEEDAAPLVAAGTARLAS